MSLHPDELLPELALETLEDPQRADTLAHVATCPRCSEEVLALREAFATLPSALAPSPAPGRDLVLDAVTPGVSDVRRFARFRRRFAALYDLPEARFDEIVSALSDPARWEPVLPGVSLFQFAPGPKHAGADAGFIRCDAGGRFPTHRHAGDEYMFIFAGGFRDDTSGAETHPGDILLMPIDTSHSFTFFADEDCISAILLYGGPPLIEGVDLTRR